MNNINNHHIAAALDALICEATLKAQNPDISVDQVHASTIEVRTLRRVLTRAAVIANPALVDPTAWDVV